MTRHRLHNEDWDFDTNCFVCEPTNDRGLRIAFFLDDERELVTAEFELTDAFSGAPTLVHGGVTLAVMDEAMAWACIAIGRQWAVTTETTTRFRRAVRVGSRYHVEARIEDHVGDELHAAARLFDRRDQLRVESSATFATLGEAQAVGFSGVAVSDANRSFLRDG